MGLAAACGIGLSAQTEIKSKTKTEVKDGKEITTTGCVARTSDGQYELTGVGGESQYLLVGKEDMSKHVGHRVQIRGTATDLGDAKVKVETKTTAKTDSDRGSDEHTQKTTTERKGDLDTPLLGVQSVKTLADSCAS